MPRVQGARFIRNSTANDNETAGKEVCNHIRRVARFRHSDNPNHVESLDIHCDNI